MRRFPWFVLASWIVALAPAAADDLVPKLEDCCLIIEFEDTYPGECLSEKYADLGIHMYRGVGECVWARDLRWLGWWSPTLPMAASTALDPSEDGIASRFFFVFDRTATHLGACFGNDGPGTSLEYRCDRANGWSGGWGPLNGNFDLDEERTANNCDTAWFQDRFGNYAITLDRLQVSFCPEYRSCRVVGDGDPYLIEAEQVRLGELCARE